jgi:hypothetical protein
VYIDCVLVLDIIDLVISQSKLFEAANVVQRFSFAEIVHATANFSNEVGRGGFGIVYKGILADGTVVAIKVLSDASQQGPQEFLNEVLFFFSLDKITFH